MIDFSPIPAQLWWVPSLFIIAALFKQLKSAKQDLTPAFHVRGVHE